MNLITITGPSGSGKTTLLNELVNKHGFTSIVSHTTRAPRAGEVDGVDYHFVNEETFNELINAGAFIENVSFCDNQYGVSSNEIIKVHKNGRTPVLIVEPNGLNQIQQFIRENKGWGIISVFMSAPTDILVSRYLSRLHDQNFKDKDTCDKHALRITSILQEWRWWLSKSQYDIIVASLKEEDIRSAIGDIKMIFKIRFE